MNAGTFTLQIVFIIISPVLHLALGRRVFKTLLQLISRVSGKDLQADFSTLTTPLFVLGLFAHLLLVLLLKSLSFPWAAAALIPLLPALFSKDELAASLFALKQTLTVNFALWFTVVLFLGLSLFDAVSSITTPWVSNAEKLPMHLGMISSFALGENFPPELHLFSGVRLEYPFLVNLWSATFWWVHPTFYSLTLVFLYQWLTVWFVVYFSLRGDSWKLLPWAVLFGGGSYDYLFQSLSTLGAAPDSAQALIEQGYPWAPFLTSLWVSERPILIGLLVVLPALGLFHSAVSNLNPQNDLEAPRVKLQLIALLIAVAPISHFYLFLSALLYMEAVLITAVLSTLLKQLISRLRRNRLEWSWGELPLALGCVTAGGALGSLFLSWFPLRQGAFLPSAGWMPWPAAQDTILLSLTNSLSMWLNNAPVWLLLLLVLWFLCAKRLLIVVLLLLFLGANLVQVTALPWNQFEVFIALYLISLSILSSLSRAEFSRGRILLVFLAIPGLFECGRIITDYHEHTVVSERQIEDSWTLRLSTEPNAVLLGAPERDSPVLLAGRRLLVGDDKTLSALGINDKSRRRKLSSLFLATRCFFELSEDAPICPGYLLWTEREQRFFGRHHKLEDFKLETVVEDFLFRIPEKSSSY